MKLPILKSLSLLLLAVPPLRAQTAADFFHAGAGRYLYTNYAEARQFVSNGLVRYHNDPKLTNLWALLNRNQQQNQQQENKDQQSKDDQQKQQEQKQQDQRQKQDQQQQNQQGQKPEDQKNEQQKQQDQQQQASKPEQKPGEKNKDQQAGKPDEKQGEQDTGDPQATATMRMTPEQAIRLLETFKAEEKNMPFRPILKTNRQDRVFKNW